MRPQSMPSNPRDRSRIQPATFMGGCATRSYLPHPRALSYGGAPGARSRRTQQGPAPEAEAQVRGDPAARGSPAGPPARQWRRRDGPAVQLGRR